MHQLGPWTDDSLIEKWIYHYSIEESRVYKKEGFFWKAYRQIPGANTRNRRYEIVEEEQFLPNKPETANQIASMRHESSRLVLENHHAWISEEEVVEDTHFDPYSNDIFRGTEQENPIDNAFKASVKCRRVLLDWYKLPSDNCAAIAEAITNGKARAISDGSFRPVEQTGTSGFTITPGKTSKDAFKGCNWVPGLKHEQSAYRSELAGINGLLSSIKIIVKKFNIRSGSIEIGLDGESAKDQAEDDFFLKIHQPSFDIILDIRRRIKELPINIKWRHIKGHAKQKGLPQDWWTQMNDKMDTLAKAYMTDQLNKNREHYTVRLWHEKWAFYVFGNKLSCINKKSIYEFLHGEKTLNYWRTHHDIPIQPSHEVDWEPARLAIKRLPLGLRRFFWKFSTGQIGNRHMLCTREEIDTPRCLLCDHPEEKLSHVLQCDNEHMKLQFKSRIKSGLPSTLKDQKTEPNLHKAIIEILCRFRDGETINPDRFSEDHGLRDAIRDQNDGLN